jgi:hypothetical protein
MFNKQVKKTEEKQAEINEERQRYANADRKYYITANMLLKLAQKALEIFENSEVAEKQQLLNFILQNPILRGRKLEFTLKPPFDTMAFANECSTQLRL